MMQVSELRIGNLILLDGEVVTLDNNLFVQLLEDAEYHAIDPIILTEEWLNNFGFEKYGIWHRLNNIYIKLNDVWGYNKIIIPTQQPKYVHQVQNLMYSIIGQELTHFKPLQSIKTI